MFLFYHKGLFQMLYHPAHTIDAYVTIKFCYIINYTQIIFYVVFNSVYKLEVYITVIPEENIEINSWRKIYVTFKFWAKKEDFSTQM